MASYQKRGKTWQYTISRMVNGKPDPIRKGGFVTKKEAQAAAAEVEQKLRKGITVHLKLEPFDEYFEKWVEDYKAGVRGNTRARYLNTLETIREHFAGVPIQHIMKRDYQTFMNGYGEAHSIETSKKLNSHIRACVRDAIDEGIITVDFTRRVKLTGSLPKRPEEKHLNYEDSKRLLKALSKPIALSHYLIILGLASGLRFAELVGLTRKDFDFTNNTLSVSKTWGYTNKMPEGFGPTKNDQSVRKIKMDEMTMTLFKSYFEHKPENILKLVFYSPESKYKVLSNTAVNKVLKKLQEQIGIADPVSAHGLRHTHASILLYKRASIYYVSERLGHKDIQTTLEYYAHVVNELREEDEAIAAKTFMDLAV